MSTRRSPAYMRHDDGKPIRPSPTGMEHTAKRSESLCSPGASEHSLFLEGFCKGTASEVSQHGQADQHDDELQLFDWAQFHDGLHVRQSVESHGFTGPEGGSTTFAYDARGNSGEFDNSENSGSEFGDCPRGFLRLTDNTPSGKTGLPLTILLYCSFAYSALACFRMGTSGSASFQSVRKSW